jgi:hypothetical protein
MGPPPAFASAPAFDGSWVKSLASGSEAEAEGEAVSAPARTRFRAHFRARYRLRVDEPARSRNHCALPHLE